MLPHQEQKYQTDAEHRRQRLGFPWAELGFPTATSLKAPTLKELEDYRAPFH